MIPQNIKRLPYGVADYEKIRADNLYYVDKTRFIPLLETSPYYLFLIRPRRFGKTLWISVLENYYDVSKRDRFEELFGGTQIFECPTPERNSYLVMTFNFSLVSPDIRLTEESFEENGRAVIADFLERYREFFDETARGEILSRPKTVDKMREIFFHSFRKGLRIFLLIDEYDNFANTILSKSGERAYWELTHGGGFFRHFFNLLKGGTSRGDAGISRLFITGVSPVTMDDVTSGFNIGNNISLEPGFNEILGFHEQDVTEMLSYYIGKGLITEDADFCLNLMSEWYDNYRFSAKAENRVFNSDMVLFFVSKMLREKAIPDHLTDQNIRIDYAKLRHLMMVDQQLNGNFGQLRRIIETGEAVCDVVPGFPLEQLTDRDNFVSLLFYFGLLSFDGMKRGLPVLRIPNLTVRGLMYGYIRDALRDGHIFRTDLWKFADLMSRMAYNGQWEPVFDFLADAVREQTSVRDYLEGEKVIQGFLLAYLNVTDFFLTRSEHETGKGFADIWLEPFLARFPDMPFGYLIELKYISRGKFGKTLLAETVQSATKQLERYADDPRIRGFSEKVTIKKLVLVYSGWDLVCREAV